MPAYAHYDYGYFANLGIKPLAAKQQVLLPLTSEPFLSRIVSHIKIYI
jgi:hypothetical protein